MKQSDALDILDLSGNITPELIAAAYRRAAMKYHPDRNPAGLIMMQAVNAARDALEDFTGNHDPQAPNYGADLNDAINAIISCSGLNIEICGAWIWVDGDTKTHKEILKGAGFKWASKKKKWNYRPAGWRSSSRGRFSMDEIRERHGSQNVPTMNRPTIAA